jgi:glutamate-ammonia-ligase adenylyltransferase
MAADPVTAHALARLGGARALANLEALGLVAGGEPVEGADELIGVLATAANGDLALHALVRLAERHPDAWAGLVAGGPGEGTHALRRAVIVAGSSAALGDLIASTPAALAALLGELDPWDPDRVRAEARAAVAEQPAEPARALAALQRRGLLRVSARDLMGLADTPRTAAELADLAQGILAAGLEVAADGVDAGLAVIGMGKLGGRELNYVSDIDVLFVAEGDWAEATRVAERLLRLLGEVTAEGRAYEIDTNLRPEGRDGPLVRSLASYSGYYQRWAHTWEFQALLKARPVAGDPEVAAAFAELAATFVWPDRLDARQVTEIRAMKDRVERSREVRKAGGRQVKLAPGGLRDIEFAVQLLQLVHGRHDRSLRSANTLEALFALAEGGYVDDGDAQLFSDAYQFLRTVEHRLQLDRLRRTHTVPVGDDARARLARSVGFRGIRAASALEQFDRELARVQSSVRKLHEKLFFRPLLERFAEIGVAEQVAAGDGKFDEAGARDRLEALGFAYPEGALEHLEALASGVSRRARLFRTLLPAILPTIAAAPDPDDGLAAFRSLADRLGESSLFLRTLRDNPPVGELLARVLGASRLVGGWLERQPEVFTQLADLPTLARRLEPEDYHRLADGLLRRGEDPERAGAALRRMKRREAARVAVRDLGGFAPVTDVGTELSGLAGACLEAGLSLAGTDGVRMAVIALGKLGGRELGYASDLDAMLVFEPAGARDQALQASERLLRLLGDITPEGQAFQLDLNLRPEGKDGPLARSLDSYRTYYERWAEPWELQALTQARPVAGDPELGAAFMQIVTPLVYPPVLPAERLAAMRRMKARVESERGAARDGGPAPRRFRPSRRGAGAPARRPGQVTLRAGDRVDLKLGPGGLADIEWTLQLLQLESGGARESLRVPGSLAALAALEADGLLDPTEAAWLRAGWELATKLRNALYLMGRRDSSVLPGNPSDQERVARMLGYQVPGMQLLADDLARTMRRVRRIHEARFYA